MIERWTIKLQLLKKKGRLRKEEEMEEEEKSHNVLRKLVMILCYTHS